jgi:trehalose 6-phosphate synthase
MARALKRALDMPLSERRERHEQLLAALRENDIYAWSSRFVAALTAAGTRSAAGSAGAPGTPGADPRRAASAPSSLR